MFNNIVLDIVIGLVFIYLLYSLLATLLQEILTVLIGLRASVLAMAIRRMLDDQLEIGGNKKNKGESQSANEGVSRAFYGHPLIKYLATSNKIVNKPSYISRETFSKVLIDLLRGKKVQTGSSHRAEIEKSLAEGASLQWEPSASLNPETRLYLNSVWVDAQGDVERFREHIEKWFDEMMDRTTGWYRKYTKIISLFIGLIIAIWFNVDSLAIIQKLHRDPKLREQMVAQADAFTKAHPNLEKELEQTRLEIENMQLAKNPQEDSAKKKEMINGIESNYLQSKKLSDSLYKEASRLVSNDIKNNQDLLGLGWRQLSWGSIPGIILTALAISFGAPFWFDLLNKLIRLRSSVNPDEASKGKTVTIKKIERVG